jgi:monoamine oxidase
LSTPEQHDIVVVGGGYAGLYAARDLTDAGYRCLILEARDRLGGRTLARTFPGTDRRVELGGAWVAPRLHPLIAAEMDRYDLDLADASADLAPTFQWRFDGKTLAGFPIQGDELYDFERILFHLIDDAHRIDDPDVARDLQDVSDLDVSVAEYLRRRGATGRTYEFFATWGALGSGARPEDWSALNALSLVAASGYSAYAWYAAVTEKLAGGSASLIDAWLEDARPEVRLSSIVRTVVLRDDEVIVSTVDGDAFRASAVVIAVPLNLWGRIEFAPALSPAKERAAREGHPNRIRKCWVLVENGPPNTICFGSGSELLWMSPEANLGDATLMVCFTAAPSTLDVTDAAAVERAVREHMPQARVIASDAHDWNADPFSRGGWPAHPPGRLSRDASALQRPEGRIAFAGADIATRWIGWLEGALESGSRAARDARAMLGAGDPLPRRPR